MTITGITCEGKSGERSDSGRSYQRVYQVSFTGTFDPAYILTTANIATGVGLPDDWDSYPGDSTGDTTDTSVYCAKRSIELVDNSHAHCVVTCDFEPRSLTQ